MKSIVIAILFLCSSGAWAGPFGLTQGTPLYKLNVIENGERDFHYKIKVPIPHTDFDFYMAIVTPRHGLCKIVGYGRTIENDSNGISARQVYGNLKASLYSKYGKSKDFDFLHAGSIWKQSYNWAKSIEVDERTFESYWDVDSGSVMPVDIRSISLKVRALSATQTYINVYYDFENIEECLSEIQAARARAL